MRRFVFFSAVFFLPFLACAAFAQEQKGAAVSADSSADSAVVMEQKNTPSSEESDPSSVILARSEIDEVPANRAESELVIKAEITPNGQINADGRAGDRTFDGSAIYGDKAGLAFSVEYYYYAFKFLGTGIGVKYGL